MRKIIASINITVDGYCDHDVITPDEEIHKHYAELLQQAGVILYGRKTFRLMEYWKQFVDSESGVKDMDEFAAAMDAVPKIVFSRTMKETGWHSAGLAKNSLEEEVLRLRRQSGKDVFVGSPGLISQLTQLSLIDEYQLCIHPVIVGSGSRLFQDLTAPKNLRTVATKTFKSGAILMYYENATPAS